MMPTNLPTDIYSATLLYFKTKKSLYLYSVVPKEEWSEGTIDWPFTLEVRLGEFSLHEMKIGFMGITKLVV